MKYIMKSCAALLLLFSSCDGFLDEKPSLSLVVPSKLADFEALLNNDNQVFNISPAIGEIGSADYFTTVERWETYSTQLEREAYIWGDEVHANGNMPDWATPFQQIFYANVVLDGIAALNISSEEQAQAERLKGTALFFRANAYHNLMVLFCPFARFDDTSDKLGLPIRASSNIQDPITRASLQEVKDFIKKDLEEALDLVPETEPMKTLPSKLTVLSLLMRVHFMEADYSKALDYGLLAMEYSPELIDLTALPQSAANPFGIFNKEVVFYSHLNPYNYFNSPLTFVDENLLELYGDDDSRVGHFFIDRGTGGLNVKAFHTGRNLWFGGIGTNEIYLTVSECLARDGRLEEAAQILESLLENRIFDLEPVTFENSTEALDFILKERRKELLFRGIRWMDLRRLNEEGAGIILTRQLGENTITLSPNSPRYVFPLPPSEVERSGIEQNPR
ncbi:RagB/SusD family nutrient uptake outer membrane protein [Arthrospiribacter ruber]|nr:RagB/SusD family nutrient uptake outer membrane protein [Arthrospiribacter ruber]